MNEVSGFEVCRQIKAVRPEVPVFFLSSDSEVDSIGEGFESGGVDYFSKQILTAELITRVSKRLNLSSKINPQFLINGDFRIDLKTGLPYDKDQLLNFTSKEYDLFRVFMENPGKVFSKDELLERLWGNINVSSNNIDTHIFNLRKKLGPSENNIVTMKGRGYMLRSLK